MTLGSKISKLRNDANMSQGDLAEKINVSRQSVSKWETGASVPDLDKLIMLSELFSVSLDDLAKDGACENQTAQPELRNAEILPARAMSTQRIVGFILLAVGLLCVAVSLALNLILSFVGVYLAVCGILCLCIKHRAALVIGWLTFLPLVYFLPRMTGVYMGAVFNPFLYQNAMLPQIAIALTMWIFMALLIFATVRKTALHRQFPLILGWIAFSTLYGYIPIALGLAPYKGIIFPIMGWLTIALLAALIFFTAKFSVATIRKISLEQ